MLCFVIMPFGNPNVDPEKTKRLNHIYDEEIKPTVESFHMPSAPDLTLRCERADRDARSGEIIMHIIEQLFAADVVVADLSGRNANVFYELGVRHALGKSTILTADNLEDIPFDLRGMRAIHYRYSPEGLASFRRELKEALSAVVIRPECGDNPVSRFLLNREIDRIKAKEAPATYDAVRQLIDEIQSLRDTIGSQGEEMRALAAGMTPRAKKQPGRTKKVDKILASLQGIWKGSPSGSLVCMRMFGGQLRAPYCYGGDSGLTAHYFNFRRVGRTIFARFEWFTDAISGYGMYKIASTDRLEGGWWLDGNVPESVRRGTGMPQGSTIQIAPNTLTRVSRDHAFPNWAEEYFRCLGKTKEGGVCE